MTARKILEDYPPFSILATTGRKLGIGPHLRNALILGALYLVCLIASWRDGTLLIQGLPNGFLESPELFAFLVAGIILPIFFERGISAAFQISAGDGLFLKKEAAAKDLARYRRVISSGRKLSGFWGRPLFILLRYLGFCIFSWNTIQNADPMGKVGFAGWDTIEYTLGYAASRPLRLYIWFFLAPTIIHIHIVSILALRSLVRSVAENKTADLQTFHADKCGGTKSIIQPLVTPSISLLVSASALAILTIWVHRSINLTTGGGLIILVILVILSYLVPGKALRDLILEEKDRKIREISKIQGVILREISQRDDKNLVSLGDLDGLDRVRDRIERISAWPQLLRIGVAASPAIIAVARPAGQMVLGWILAQLGITTGDS